MVKNTKATTVEATRQNDRLNDLEAKMDRLVDLFAGLQVQPTTVAPPAAKPAVVKQERRVLEPVVPEFAFEVVEGKWGPALNMTFEGRKMSRWMYASEMEILIRHLPEIQAALRKVGK